MPLDADQLWTVTDASTRIAAIRDDLDFQVGTSVNYTRTADGWYTWTIARALNRLDQGVSLVVSATTLDSAPPQAVIARARDARLTPFAAVAAEVMVDVSGSGTALSSATITDDHGNTWAIVTAYTDNGLTETPFVDGELAVDTDTKIHLRATTAGAISIGSTFTPSPSWSGVTLGWERTIVAPRDAETTAELRARLAESEVYPSGSLAGMRAALLNIAGVSAASVTRESAGVVSVGVVYSGAVVDLVDIGQTIYDHLPAGCTTTGASSVTAVAVDSEDVTVYYTTLATQSVTVACTLASDDTVADTDLITAATKAIAGVFNRLNIGETVRILQLYRAIGGIEGVTGALITLNGSGADVSPTSATTRLSPSTTVTVSP